MNELGKFEKIGISVSFALASVFSLAGLSAEDIIEEGRYSLTEITGNEVYAAATLGVCTIALGASVIGGIQALRFVKLVEEVKEQTIEDIERVEVGLEAAHKALLMSMNIARGDVIDVASRPVEPPATELPSSL